MEFKELAGKSSEELQSLLREHRQRLEQSRRQVAEGTSKQVRAVRSTRKLVARILTALRQYRQAAPRGVIPTPATAGQAKTPAGAAGPTRPIP